MHFIFKKTSFKVKIYTGIEDLTMIQKLNYDVHSIK